MATSGGGAAGGGGGVTACVTASATARVARASTVTSASGTRPDGGTGEGESTTTVQVEGDGSERVSTGEGDTGGKVDGTRAELDLSAGNVELSTTGRVGSVGSVGLVEGDPFGTDEVTTSSEVGEDDVVLTLVADEDVGSPGSGRVTALVDLDPGVGARLGDVDEDGTLVGLWKNRVNVSCNNLG